MTSPIWVHCKLFSCVLLFVVLSSSAGFASDSPNCDAPPFTFTPAALLQATASPEVDTSTGAVVFCQGDSYDFAADGSAVETIRLTFKVTTQAAAESWAAIESRWEPWHEQKHRIRARVITPDAQEHWLDQKT